MERRYTNTRGHVVGADFPDPDAANAVATVLVETRSLGALGRELIRTEQPSVIAAVLKLAQTESEKRGMSIPTQGLFTTPGGFHPQVRAVLEKYKAERRSRQTPKPKPAAAPAAQREPEHQAGTGIGGWFFKSA